MESHSVHSHPGLEIVYTAQHQIHLPPVHSTLFYFAAEFLEIGDRGNVHVERLELDIRINMPVISE